MITEILTNPHRARAVRGRRRAVMARSLGRAPRSRPRSTARTIRRDAATWLKFFKQNWHHGLGNGFIGARAADE
jgi:hypothetical protein